MSSQNLALVRRAVEDVWNQGNYDVLPQLVANDIVVHGSSPGDDIHGPEGIRRFYTAFRAAFPDIRFTIEDQVADGDRVVTRWSAQATHLGEFHGLPPTGKPIRLTGIDIDRIAGGKVVECWQIADELGLLKQLGAVPTPDAARR